MALFLFIVLPAIELLLLIQIGKSIGAIETVALVIFTGILGAALATRQGLQVLRQAQEDLQAGRMPGDALADGMFILIAAALLITPGVLTDVIGLLCLIPPTRRTLKVLAWRWFERKLRSGNARFVVFTSNQPARPQGDITAEYEVVSDDQHPPRQIPPYNRSDST